MTKDQIRRTFRSKRMALSGQDKLKMDDLLLIQLQKIDLGEVQVLFNYFPAEKLSEPNTLLFAKYMHFLYPDLQIAYPKIISGTNEMDAILITDNTEFSFGMYNLQHPESGKVVSPKEIDVVFMPLLAFNNQGYRVGYGKGFYDNYLTQCREDVTKVGFSYFPPIEEIDDLHQNDIPLDICITCDQIYAFEKNN